MSDNCSDPDACCFSVALGSWVLVVVLCETETIEKLV